MSCTTSKLRSISKGTMAAAIGVSLSICALAQTSGPLRTPRRLVQGKIESPYRLADIGAAASASPNTAQGPGGVPLGPGPGCDVFPASANIGTAVPLSYFGPPPSSVNQSLVGPVQLLNTGQIDSRAARSRSPFISGI